METTAEELSALVAALNPVLESEVQRLRASLGRFEPIATTRATRSRRGVLIAFLTAALLATGAALAAGVSPLRAIHAFTGIGAANRARTSKDVLDPATLAILRHSNEQARSHGFPQLLLDTARLVRRLPGGYSVFVLTDTAKDLCVEIDPGGGGCGKPLSQAEPTTIGTFRHDRTTPPISFGVAKNSIVSVSFRGGGSEHTMPVVHNVWAYEGDSSALESITVHYADGRTKTITH
jgi:hypothetical protein